MAVMSKKALSAWKSKMERKIREKVEERFHRNVPGTEWTVVAVQKGLIHARKETMDRRRGPEWVSTIRLTWRDNSNPPHVWNEIVPYNRKRCFNNSWSRIDDLAHDLGDFGGGPTDTEVFDPFVFVGKVCGKTMDTPRWFAKPASPEEVEEWVERPSGFSNAPFNYYEIRMMDKAAEPHTIRFVDCAGESERMPVPALEIKQDAKLKITVARSEPLKNFSTTSDKWQN
jgi:hypothetical protein